MQEINTINGQLFRIQLIGKMLNQLIDQQLLVYKKGETEKIMYSMANMLKDGIKLEDYEYEFRVKDKHDGKTYIA